MKRILLDRATSLPGTVGKDGQWDEYADMGGDLVRHLGKGRCLSCRMVSAGRKIGTRLVEFEVVLKKPGEDAGSGEAQLFVGKIYRSDRGQHQYDVLTLLREAGFCPPSPFTVVGPVAYIPEKCLLLQEKAQGSLLADLLFDRSEAADDALARAVDWLVALHGAPVTASPRLPQVRTDLCRYGSELAALLPGQARRVEMLTNRVLAGLEAERLTPLVPSHGDFHPENVFVDGSGQVTVIDLDRFGMQERIADVAYFLVQTAIMGYLRLGSFASTARARNFFLQRYLAAKLLPGERLALYVAIGFLQSLHYELCVLRNGKNSIVEPWLSNCERCLSQGDSTLVDDATE